MKLNERRSGKDRRNWKLRLKLMRKVKEHVEKKRKRLDLNEAAIALGISKEYIKRIQSEL